MKKIRIVLVFILIVLLAMIFVACGNKDKTDVSYKTVPSRNLDFVLNSTNDGYVVSGIGHCKDTDIVIPSYNSSMPVTGIADYAFVNCTELKSITIPAGVKSIGREIFTGCTSLERIKVDGYNTVYHSSGNCLIETASKTLIAGCKTSVIPMYGTVTSIGACSFKSCQELTSITIPDSVTSIGSSAFYGCSGLTSVTIQDSVKSIGNSAFYGCTGLMSVTIPDSVTIMDNFAFAECSGLTNIIIPNGMKEIGYYVFFGCTGLKSITISDSVTSIGDYALFNCKELDSINYNSTIEHWKKIAKGSKWIDKSCMVNCTDGTIDVFDD